MAATQLSNLVEEQHAIILLALSKTCTLKEHVVLMDNNGGHLWVRFKKPTENIYCVILDFSWAVSKLVDKMPKDNFFDFWLIWDKFGENVKSHFPEVLKIIFTHAD